MEHFHCFTFLSVVDFWIKKCKHKIIRHTVDRDATFQHLADFIFIHMPGNKVFLKEIAAKS